MSKPSLTAADLGPGDFFVRTDHDSGVVFRVVSTPWRLSPHSSMLWVTVEAWGHRTDGRVQSMRTRADKPVRRLGHREVLEMLDALHARVLERGVTVRVRLDGQAVAA